MYLYIGEKGFTLKTILNYYNNQDFDEIEVRCRYKEVSGELIDDLFGFCKYSNGKLESLDGDTYSLEDLYIKWKKDGTHLTVWTDGYLSEEYKY